jgi:hypothetical protein
MTAFFLLFGAIESESVLLKVALAANLMVKMILLLKQAETFDKTTMTTTLYTTIPAAVDGSHSQHHSRSSAFQ